MNYVLFKNNVIYLSIFVCVGFSWLLVLSPVLVSQGYSSVAVSGLLIAVASLVAGFERARASVVAAPRLCSTGLVAPGHVGSSWIRDRTCVAPALAGRFFTTEPPGKP